mmetsp:Transcript_12199/g.19917  ORF Transcript_12199/g.19917 Transcript_12199/m.19917 type:complete len:127 (-) Transcript_12199:374-754(-)
MVNAFRHSEQIVEVVAVEEEAAVAFLNWFSCHTLTKIILKRPLGDIVHIRCVVMMRLRSSSGSSHLDYDQKRKRREHYVALLVIDAESILFRIFIGRWLSNQFVIPPFLSFVHPKIASICSREQLK